MEAAEEQTLRSQIESDKASLIFAQGELALAQQSGRKEPDAGAPTGETPLERAEARLQGTRLMVKIDDDRAQLQSEIHEMKDYSARQTAQQELRDR